MDMRVTGVGVLVDDIGLAAVTDPFHIIIDDLLEGVLTDLFRRIEIEGNMSAFELRPLIKAGLFLQSGNTVFGGELYGILAVVGGMDKLSDARLTLFSLYWKGDRKDLPNFMTVTICRRCG